jgi:hypothetical protein
LIIVKQLMKRSLSGDGGSSRNTKARSISPLIDILEEAVKAQPPTVVKSSLTRHDIYTGFAEWHNLSRSNCRFQPMNTNRSISDAVVKQRVHTNLEHWTRYNCYCEFGQINLLILKSSVDPVFFIMDGQHRVRTMEELNCICPDNIICFQFRAKVVSTEAEAHEDLMHYQNSYPADPRSFFATTAENKFAAALLDRLHASCNPQLLKPIVTEARCGKRTGDPSRPFMNDNVFYWLVQHSGLVRLHQQGISSGMDGSADQERAEQESGSSGGSSSSGSGSSALATAPLLQIKQDYSTGSSSRAPLQIKPEGAGHTLSSTRAGGGSAGGSAGSASGSSNAVIDLCREGSSDARSGSSDAGSGSSDAGSGSNNGMDRQALQQQAVDAVWGVLMNMSVEMDRRSRTNTSCLGVGVSDRMVRQAREHGCFLGFFREDKLTWEDAVDWLQQGAAHRVPSM